jgi:deoxyribose-phosphate aldolase
MSGQLVSDAGGAPEFDRLVRAVADEVSRRLAAEYQVKVARTPRDQPCTGCGQCARKCSDNVKAVLAAGAERVAAAPGTVDVEAAVAGFIDHTILKPDATPREIDQVCDEALKHGFAAVCVNPVWVRRVAVKLRGSKVTVCSVVGFPLGAQPTAAKRYETRQALRDGAREIDMVINVGLLKAGDDARVRDDIRALAEACHESGAKLKVIIEAALLSDEEKARACRLSKEAGADFVKTSTGFGPGGATIHDVDLMRRTVGADVGVKASGGVRSFHDLTKLLAAGATRIGASASVRIMREAAEALGPSRRE